MHLFYESRYDFVYKASPAYCVVETQRCKLRDSSPDLCVSPTATTAEPHEVRRALHRLYSYRTWHTGDTLTGLDPHTTQAAPDMGGAFPSEVSWQPPRGYGDPSLSLLPTVGTRSALEVPYVGLEDRAA